MYPARVPDRDPPDLRIIDLSCYIFQHKKRLIRAAVSVTSRSKCAWQRTRPSNFITSVESELVAVSFQGKSSCPTQQPMVPHSAMSRTNSAPNLLNIKTRISGELSDTL